MSGFGSCTFHIIILLKTAILSFPKPRSLSRRRLRRYSAVPGEGEARAVWLRVAPQVGTGSPYFELRFLLINLLQKSLPQALNVTTWSAY